MNTKYFEDNWWLVLFLVIWTLIWKGLALWISARKNDKTWFIALLIINTAGILEIFYIFLLSKRENNQVLPAPKK